MANIIPITSFSAPELDVFARLTENQLVNRADPANAMFIAESPLVIGRALDGGCVPLSKAKLLQRTQPWIHPPNHLKTFLQARQQLLLLQQHNGQPASACSACGAICGAKRWSCSATRCAPRWPWPARWC